MHLLPLLVAAALADDAVSLQVVRYGQVGTATPGLTLVPNLAASSLNVRVECGGKVQERSGPAAAGEHIDFRFEVPAGTYACKGSLAGDFADGTSGDMPLSFQVTQFPPLQIRLVPGSVDLTNRRIAVTLDRPAGKVEVTAIGAKGAEMGAGMLPTSASPGTAIVTEWAKPTGEVIKVRVKAFDDKGFWSELLVSVWSYAIPHEDVVFATNSSTIEESEVYKLETALAEANKVYTKYEGEVKVRLYVGGHTDTVGDAAFNDTLSQERALSLARWFKAHAFAGEVYYQGFGESKLAVKTADQVDEPRNRRADYILAGSAPAGAEWKELK
jgi:outer membrane protein OmpA-like peptidoglycan-associated protein